jgi:hypothetical protein
MRHATVFAVALSSFVLGCTDHDDDGHDHEHSMTMDPSSATMGATTTNAGPSTEAPAGAGTDYADPDLWLCRPGRQDACAVDLSSTIVEADGTLTRETWSADPEAAIDCFYVYPTVSVDATPNSDLVAGPEETNVVAAQFARFGSQCRLYAPLYRQVTLTALRAALSGMPMTPDRALGYNDVVAAWRHYLEHDNQGRGVVLVGHSQGSSVLTQLIAEHLDSEPAEPRLISALLMGTNISVPRDADVGGSFQHVPLCRSASQTGCVITYASFRADLPPSPTALFAQSMDPSLVAACTNPAALEGGSGELHAYLTAAAPVLSSSPSPQWVTPAQAIETPYVSVPGLLSAECVSGERGSYLAVTVHADPDDPRTDDIAGDVVMNGMVQQDWGLHLIDAHLAIGNLVEIVAEQAGSYLARTAESSTTRP